jgi:hypothetical protein
MANVKVMYKFFDQVDLIAKNLSSGSEESKVLLDTFFHRVLRICDGLEGPDIDWNGIALVARDDLPENIDEINDDFLNEAWTNR